MNRTHWYVFWITFLNAASATAELMTCVVVRHPTSAQAAEARGELETIAEQLDKPNANEVEVLREMFQRFPVPFTGLQLARGYLKEGNSEKAHRVLLEVSMQDPGLYLKVSPQREAVTKAARLLPGLYEGQTLIINMHGAASDVKVWVAGSQCAGPVQIEPGNHQILWRLKSPACVGSSQVELTHTARRVVDVQACQGGGSTESRQPESESPRLSKWTTLVAGGVSVVGFGAAVLLSLHAQNLKEHADCPNNRCSSAGANDIASAMESKDWSTVGYVVGGVGLGVAAIGLFTWHPWSSSAPEHPQGQVSSQPLRLSPLIGANGAGVSLQGGF